MICRELNLVDVDKLCYVIQDNFSDGWNKSQLLSAFNNGRFLCLGAFIDNKLAGVIYYDISFETADLEGVVTKKEYLRQGVAKSLMIEGERALKERGVNKVLLEVRFFNTPAINLYNSCGYSKIHQRKDYYPDGEDAIIMCKELGVK